MIGKFQNSQEERSSLSWIFRKEFQAKAYLTEEESINDKTIVDFNFLELKYYGLIDNHNNSIIPNEDFIVNYRDGRVFDFVADSLAAMQLNIAAAESQGKLTDSSGVFSRMSLKQSYKDPKAGYGEYLYGILDFYNKTHIPITLGKHIITSYETYVKYFFNFFLNLKTNTPLTLTSYNTSRLASKFNSGLMFRYYDLAYDRDMDKYRIIIANPCFDYFKNLCLNTGFSIVKNSPNVLQYNINSPATDNIKISYGLYNLTSLFNNRYIKTYTLDMNIIFNSINIYYNKYAAENSLLTFPYVSCGKTKSQVIELSQVQADAMPLTDGQLLSLYEDIRSKEENHPFSRNERRNIKKKANYLLNSLDKQSAMSYINDKYRDQVWNRDFGYHDTLKLFLQEKKQEMEPNQGGGGSSY